MDARAGSPQGPVRLSLEDQTHPVTPAAPASSGPIEGFDPTRLGRRLVARQEFAEFAERFSAEGDTRIKAAGRGRQQVSRGFVIDEAMMADFRSHLESRRLTFNEAAEAAFASDETFIRAMMHYEIDIALFGRDEARRNLTASDPQAQYAVTCSVCSPSAGAGSNGRGPSPSMR